VKIDKDVDGCNHHLGEDEDDDNPFQQLALSLLLAAYQTTIQADHLHE
jgi:hypothetical protein